MKTNTFNKALVISIASLVCLSTLSAIKIVVPDQYKDQVDAIKEAEREERQRELEGVSESSEGGIDIASQEAPAETKPSKVDADEFLIQSVVEATATATEYEGTLAADEGLVSGQIVDKETGEPLSGVAIIIEGTDVATVTAEDGRYSLGPTTAGNYTLSFIKSGYIEANVTDYNVAGGEVSVFPFALPPRPAEMSDEVYELQDFTVTAEQANQMMLEIDLRQNSLATMDILTSEDFAKFAASDVAEAISKISGASLSDGKYVVMRGLNDRYNTTLINGVRLPSPDPDRKAVAMDIFPTSLFEGIVARKTFTSDMPGESSGGSIELRTKSIPEDFFAKLSISVGQQMTSSNTDVFLSDPEQVSLMGWLQGDDYRGYSLKPGTEEFVDNYPTGIGGVNFPRMGANVGSFPKFGDRSYSVSFGDSWQVKNWLSVGAVFGAKLSEKQRTSFKEIYKKRIELGEVVLQEKALAEQGGGVLKSEQEYSLSMLLGLGMQIGDHSSLDYTYLRAESLSSVAEIAQYQKYGQVSLYGTSLGDDYHDYLDIELGVEERLLEAHQFGGEHIFELAAPGEWTFNWYYTDAFMSQKEPDQRITAEYFPDYDTFSADPGLDPVNRFQRETKQDSEMYGWNLGQEFSIGDKATVSFKFGVDRESSEREFEQLEMDIVDERYVTDPYWGAMPYPDAPFLSTLFSPEEYADGNVFVSDFASLDGLIQSGYLDAGIAEKTPQFVYLSDDLDDPLSLLDAVDIQDSLALGEQLQEDFLAFNQVLSTKTIDDYNSEITPLFTAVNDQQNFLVDKYGADLTVAKNDALNAIDTYGIRLKGKLQNQKDYEAAVSALDSALAFGIGPVTNFEALFGEAYTDSARALEMISDGNDNGTGFDDTDQALYYGFLYQGAINSFEASDAVEDQALYNDPSSSLFKQLDLALSDFEGAIKELEDIEQQYQEYLADLGELEALLASPAANLGAPIGDAFSFFDDEFYVFRTPRGFSLYGDESIQTAQFDQVGGYFQARGENEVKSFYMSGDIKLDDFLFFDSVRLASGIRKESTKLSYELIDNAPGEPASSSVVGSNVSPTVVASSEIDQTDDLNYFALILEPFESFKIHLSRSTTVAKPTFREIAPFPIFNLADRSFEMGNPGLVLRAPGQVEHYNNRTQDFAGKDDDDPSLADKFVLPPEFAGLDIAEVESRDIRFEYYTPLDGMISIGYFEKDVAAPIERVYAYTAGGVDVNTFINNDNDAKLWGIEFEVQQNLGIINLPFVTLGGNYTKIDAEVTRSGLEQDALTDARYNFSLEDPERYQEGGQHGSRSLYNQPEFVANAFISFDIEKTGTKLTFSNGWTGRQLDRAGGIADSLIGVPDLYWDKFSALNVVLEQKITDHMSLRISAKNINSPVRKMFEDDIFFTGIRGADPKKPFDLKKESGGSKTDREEYESWRSRQKIDPTFSVSISGTF